MSVRRIQRLLLIGMLVFGICFMFLSIATQYIEEEKNNNGDAYNMRILDEIGQELEQQRELNNEVLAVLESFAKKRSIFSNEDPCHHMPAESPEIKLPERLRSKKGNYTSAQIHKSSEVCQNLPQNAASSDIDMVDVYDKLPFDSPKTGEWQQNVVFKTSDAEWVGKKLQVFVIPHSHNDPGWLKTVGMYFIQSTQHILNNVVDALSQDPKRRFIWAEMSYLSMWWKIATADRKIKMKTLVDNGQLEMVTAGWVMPDEANTHYFAMIDQMIEGNEWLSRNLGVVPKNGWAIDPFGLSSTMAYILKKMDFDNMLIQRVHYAVKKYLASQKSFEFRWRQSWSTDTHTDILCHMIPFAGYDVRNSCGPDPSICCNFDFARLQHRFRPCDLFFMRPSPITEQNVAKKSLELLDQYRKKSKLFKTNTLLVPLGDDFRYSSWEETLAQFENYAKIFDYVNSHPELHAELRFGTLSEYFQAMKQEIGGEHKLPTLTGDFFTYSDRNDDYWSGYYVSRPYHKMQDRVLESHLRGAEMLFSLALPMLKSSKLRSIFVTATYPLLVEARQNLGLFQHHDGITGTAKDHVVVDYGNKLMKSVMDTKKIQMMSAHLLLVEKLTNFNPDVMVFDFDEIYREQNQPPLPHVINLSFEEQEMKIIVYNSLTYERTGVLAFHVPTPYIAISTHHGDILPSQTSLVWKDDMNAETEKFQLHFLASVPAIGLTTYTIRNTASNKRNKLSKTSLYNVPKNAKKSKPPSPFQVMSQQTRKYLILENDHIEAKISPDNGYLQYLTNKFTKETTKIAISFVKYSTVWSGAYLFHPEGPATPHINSKYKPLIRIITGPVLSQVHVLYPNLLHRIILYQGNGKGTQPLGVHVQNDVDVRNGYDNKEIAMRITSDVRSNDKFFTDLNGFQIQERTNYAKLPLQANFYPMPAMAYIQDDHMRLSLFTGQPLGVSSLREGQLEVIMDRRLMQDDFRGLSQGVKDNVKTPESFVILLEHWNKDGSEKSSSTLSYPSLAAHRMSWELLHPMRSMSSKIMRNPISLRPQFSPLSDRSWPCDVHLLNLRSIQDQNKMEPTEYSALLLHRVGRECTLKFDRCFQTICQNSDSDVNKSSDVTIASLFSVHEIIPTSLSLQNDRQKVTLNSAVTIKPMEIEAFKIKF